MPAEPDAVVQEPSSYRLVPVDNKPLTQTVSFRVTDDEALRLAALRDTFNPPQWATTFRWLLSQPDVKAAIAERLAASVS